MVTRLRRSTPVTSSDEDAELAAWIDDQREKRRRGRLTADEVAILERLALDWDMHSDRWERWAATLEQFVARRGHATPSVSDPDYAVLGDWVATQRLRHRDNESPSERTTRLEDDQRDIPMLLSLVS